ncbi:MAG: aminotransferase class III-fold pyridoxal phosphate-dependent enzyme, partial [Rhodospirillaceae bacterium]|nr:aminotransferase class III-fold pyridoxal phosphate-dependent enzyme [Rhodospirillaceae bacterium]
THTISSGPAGYARAHGIEADALVLGKPVAGGIPCAVYGMSAALAARVEQAKRTAPPGHSGVGTTLSANMFAMAAMRANLEQVMTEAAYAHMTALAAQLAQGLREVIARQQLPWCVTQVGARTEFQFCPEAPGNGTQAGAIHLYLLNRGVLITPFHNMLLVCPDTSSADVQRLLAVFEECVQQLR